jgi:signal transduction histidine kinase/CheY-like chemotaxis protein
MKDPHHDRDLLTSISRNLASGMIYQVLRMPDGTRKFTYLSSVVERFYGCSAADAMADPMRIYGRVHPEDVRRVIDEEEQAHRTMTVFKTEVRMLWPDGTVRWSRFVSQPRPLPGGITCWDGIEFDVTDMKKVEAQLAHAQKMESIGRLAGGVAHDFNNMLAVILGHAEMAMGKLPGDHAAQDDLSQVMQAARRSATMTRQLLAFARKQTVSPEVLDLNEVVQGLTRMLVRLAGEDIRLEFVPQPELWPVRMDRSQVDQVLANLCVNARDAVAAGGQVRIETANAALDAAAVKGLPGLVPGDYVRLSVVDDGCGMDAETQAKLFEPFFTTKKPGEGTGLGLATVYGIVKQNQGYINVSSAVGKGTCVAVYLPRTTGTPCSQNAVAAKAPTRGGGDTILVVEDEPALLDMTRQMLLHHGYKVLVSGSAAAAMELVRTHSGPIDLLLTDVVMPDMSGPELADAIQAVRPIGRRLYMSGYTAEAVARHGVLEPGVCFIQKPFSARELALRVSEALGR